MDGMTTPSPLPLNPPARAEKDDQTETYTATDTTTETTANTTSEDEEHHRRPPINVLVTPNPEPQNEPSIGIDLLDPEIMVAAANDYRTGALSHIGIYRSTDGGLHWINAIPPLPPEHVSSGDPVVVFGYPRLCLVGGAAYGSVGEAGGGSIIVYRSD
ncbi:MAG: hypothetical protein ACM3XM_17100 [Mycobacterium leprae]